MIQMRLSSVRPGSGAKDAEGDAAGGLRDGGAARGRALLIWLYLLHPRLAGPSLGLCPYAAVVLTSGVELSPHVDTWMCSSPASRTHPARPSGVPSSPHLGAGTPLAAPCRMPCASDHPLRLPRLPLTAEVTGPPAPGHPTLPALRPRLDARSRAWAALWSLPLRSRMVCVTQSGQTEDQPTTEWR